MQMKPKSPRIGDGIQHGKFRGAIMFFSPEHAGVVGYEADRLNGKVIGEKVVRKAFRTNSLHFVEEAGGIRWFMANGPK